jgi:hypothetical protein
MSRSVDIRCLKCGSYLGLDINHGDDECFALLELVPELAAVGAKVDERLWRFIDFGRVFGIAKFFADHHGEGHDLAVYDEYDDVNRGCGERGEKAGFDQHGAWRSSSPSERASNENGGMCRLAKGHAGPHSRFEVTEF